MTDALARCWEIGFGATKAKLPRETVYRKGISMNRKLLPMLVCGLLVCHAVCGCAVKPQTEPEPQTEQEKAVSEIKKLGGIANLDDKGPDAAVIGVILGGTKATDADLEHLKGLTRLQTISLNQTAVTDGGLAHLKGLTKLQAMFLTGTQVTDAGLEHLKGLTQLQTLRLDDTQVTDAGLVAAERPGRQTGQGL
jgi:hypothetical protein